MTQFDCFDFNDAEPQQNGNDEMLQHMQAAAQQIEDGRPPAEQIQDGAENEDAGQREEGTKRTRLTAREYLARPDTQWIIRNVLPATGIGWLYGPSGAGKSFFALDMACHIALGNDWFGNKTSKRPVLYLVLEGTGQFSNRIRAWQIYHNQILPDDLLFDLSEFQFSNSFLVDNFIEGLPKESLVIIDTQACCSLGLDENSAKDAAIIIEGAKKIVNACKGFVLLIHHTGKDTSKGGRGSSSFFAAMDVVLLVENDKTWRIEKNKDGPQSKKYCFNTENIELGFDDDGYLKTSLVVISDEKRQEELDEKTKQKNKKISDEKRVKLTDNETEALKAFNEALDKEGLEILNDIENCNNGAVKIIDVEVWRKYFYKYSSAEEKNKKEYFKRANSGLSKKVQIFVRYNWRSNYNIDNLDDSEFEKLLAKVQGATGQQGNSGQQN